MLLEKKIIKERRFVDKRSSDFAFEGPEMVTYLGWGSNLGMFIDGICHVGRCGPYKKGAPQSQSNSVGRSLAQMFAFLFAVGPTDDLVMPTSFSVANVVHNRAKFDFLTRYMTIAGTANAKIWSTFAVKSPLFEDFFL